MSVRLHRIATAAVLALAVGSPLTAQSVLLRLSPEQGLVSHYVMKMVSHVATPMMNSDQPVLVGTVYNTQTVVGVEGDVIELEMVADSAQMSSPAMPQMADQMPDLSGQRATIRMDSRGHLVRMSDASGMPAVTQEFVNQMAGSGFGMELPEHAVGPGETWTARRDMSFAAGVGNMTMDVDVTYTLASMDGDLATIVYEGPVTISTGAGMGMDGTGSISGTTVIDIRVGRLYRSETQIDTEMNAGGMTVSAEQTITMQLLP